MGKGQRLPTGRQARFSAGGSAYWQGAPTSKVKFSSRGPIFGMNIALEKVAFERAPDKIIEAFLPDRLFGTLS